MQNEMIEKLKAPFSLKERKGVGNITFKYVATEDILERMNQVFKGNWSTEIRTVDKFEDQVVVCVRVYVWDPDSKQLFWHDGYASHSIQRFTSGQNQGKAMDVGNTYKAAVSKAIKTAVTRWGVALFLEDEEEDAKTSSFSSVGFGGPAKGAESTAVFPEFVSPSTTKPSTQAAPVLDFPFNIDSVTTTQTKQTNPKPVEASKSMPEEAGGEVSSVQLYAMESLQSIHGMTYMQLAKKALGDDYAVPANPRELTYDLAAKIIQYGNNIR
jgi:hypothetical protein